MQVLNQLNDFEICRLHQSISSVLSPKAVAPYSPLSRSPDHPSFLLYMYFPSIKFPFFCFFLPSTLKAISESADI